MKVYIGMNFFGKVFLLKEDSFPEKGEGEGIMQMGSGGSSFLNEARGSTERCKLFLSFLSRKSLLAEAFHSCSHFSRKGKTRNRKTRLRERGGEIWVRWKFDGIRWPTRSI